jgi:hypothetical protein
LFHFCEIIELVSNGNLLQYVYPNQMKYVFNMQNCSNNVNQGCIAANPSAPHLCMFAEYSYPYINTPIFVLNSMYDSWSLMEIFTVNMATSRSWESCIFAINNCTSTQIGILNSVWQTSTFLCLLCVYCVNLKIYCCFRLLGASPHCSNLLESWKWGFRPFHHHTLRRVNGRLQLASFHWRCPYR